MGIWIRSQDKKRFIEVSCTEIVTGNEGEFDIHRGTEKSRFVGMASVIGNEMMFGAYNSEAEAIQVLDMIQDHINNLAYVQFYRQDMDFVPPVFQMPPAGFSQPSKEPASNMEKDLDLHKEALTMLLDSNDYITCDNCPLKKGCSKLGNANCIPDLREHFLNEARESIAKAEGDRWEDMHDYIKMGQELEQHKEALILACEELVRHAGGSPFAGSTWRQHFLAKARGAANDLPTL